MISHFGSVAYKSVLQVTLGHFCIDRYLPEYTVCMQTLEMQLPGNKEETWMKLEDMEEKPELDGGGWLTVVRYEERYEICCYLNSWKVVFSLLSLTNHFIIDCNIFKDA